jgi:hypothetical protein
MFTLISLVTIDAPLNLPKKVKFTRRADIEIKKVIMCFRHAFEQWKRSYKGSSSLNPLQMPTKNWKNSQEILYLRVWIATLQHEPFHAMKDAFTTAYGATLHKWKDRTNR